MVKRKIENIQLESREVIAENMKERIYSTITLLAVLTEMWLVGNNSERGAIGTIVGAVVSIWLATLVANRLSYRAVHGRSITRQEYAKMFFTTSGLLTPAIIPVAAVVASSITHAYTIETALLVSIIICLLTLFGFSFTAGRRIYDNIWRLLLVSLLEMSVGAVVIAIKLLAGK